jgi:hypothetical protein
MKIKIKSKSHWSGTHFQILIDGIKFPKERGEYYQPSGNTEEDKKQKAIHFAIAENEGKFLSPGGIIYKNKKEYLNKMEAFNEN